MKAKFLGKSNPRVLLHGKIYNIIDIERKWYRIIDEAGHDPDDPYDQPPGYLYPPELFEIVES